MVKKLMKHELIALFRILVWIMAAVILLGILARIGFETTKFTGDNIKNGFGIGAALSTGLITFAWATGLMALFYVAVILSLVRFFRSLFTGEGYLTFSLPATPTQLLVAKFLSALIATAACVAVAIISIAIALPANAWNTLIERICDLWGIFGEYLASDPLIAIELVLMNLAALPSGLLYLYLIASIGQLFTKGRVGITVALYFGVSEVLGVLFSLFIVPIIMTGISAHGFLWAMIIVLVGFDVGSFFLIRYILMRKVNLVV